MEEYYARKYIRFAYTSSSTVDRPRVDTLPYTIYSSFKNYPFQRAKRIVAH